MVRYQANPTSPTHPHTPKAQATVFLVNGDTYLGAWKGAAKHGTGTYQYAATGSHN